MKKSVALLPYSIAASNASSNGNFVPTGGNFYTADASLDSGATAAVIDIYVSNSQINPGVLAGTITLSTTTPADSITASADATGWGFVRAVIRSSTGNVRAVAACVGE